MNDKVINLLELQNQWKDWEIVEPWQNTLQFCLEEDFGFEPLGEEEHFTHLFYTGRDDYLEFELDKKEYQNIDGDYVEVKTENIQNQFEAKTVEVAKPTSYWFWKN